MNTRRVLTALCALVAVCSIATVAQAGGGQHYPNGAEAHFCGAAPPPGWYVVDYFLYYQADQFRDNNGDKVTAGPFADFDATVWADVVRLIYSSKVQLFGGNWLAHIFVPYLHVDYDSLGVSDSGIGDIIVDPFIIGWHGATYHAVAGIDIYVPVGDYERGNPASVGKNFWTIEPVAAFAGMYKSGFAWNVKLMYDFNTKNDDWLNPATATIGKLEPGQEFHFDYAVDYLVGAGIRLGVAGYGYWQITDDEFDGVKIPDDRGQVFAIGPALNYMPKQNLCVEARYVWETAAENRPEGSALWLKVVLGF
jgi:hypothetical protein